MTLYAYMPYIVKKTMPECIILNPLCTFIKKN